MYAYGAGIRLPSSSRIPGANDFPVLIANWYLHRSPFGEPPRLEQQHAGDGKTTDPRQPSRLRSAGIGGDRHAAIQRGERDVVERGIEQNPVGQARRADARIDRLEHEINQITTTVRARDVARQGVGGARGSPSNVVDGPWNEDGIAGGRQKVTLRDAQQLQNG